MKKTESNRAQGRIRGNRIGCVLAAVILTAACFIGIGICRFAAPAAAGTDVYKYYTSINIKKGDTLWSIANEYMTEEYDGIEEYILEVRRLNHLCGDGIRAGGYLAIPRYAKADP